MKKVITLLHITPLTLAIIPLPLLVSYISIFISWRNEWELTWLLTGGLFFGLALLSIFTYTFSMWSAIQDGKTKYTAMQALLRNFIPVYFLYWLYVCIWGFSKEANKYIERNKVAVAPLPTWVFFWYITTWFLSAIPYVGIVTVPVAIVLVSAMLILANDRINAIISKKV